jgi:peroxiredoxin Q/BCP
VSWLRLGPGLRAGDPAPDFERSDEDGTLHRLSDYRGRWLLLFFYPEDNTPGCIREACRFNDDYDAFAAEGAVILGCSGQDAASHRRFREGCRLRYRLLTDPGRVLRDAYRVPTWFRLADGRCSYLIDPQGIIRWVFHSESDPEAHAVGALQHLRQAAAARSL